MFETLSLELCRVYFSEDVIHFAGRNTTVLLFVDVPDHSHDALHFIFGD